MASMQFEPFGEPMARGADFDPSRARGGAVRRGVLRAGIGAFWLIAVAIVIARAIYFDPNFAETFMRVATLSK